MSDTMTINPVAQRLADWITDGRQITNQRPRSWRPALRESIPVVLTEMIDTYGPTVDGYSDEQIGEEFNRRMLARNRADGYVYHHNAEWGAALRDGLRVASPLSTWPTVPSNFRLNHEAQVGLLRGWAENGTGPEPDYTSVDATMRALVEAGYWPDDACGTTAEAKTFLSDVMRYRRTRSESDQATWEPGSYARVTKDQPEGAWATVGTLIQLDGAYNGARYSRADGDDSPAFLFHGVLPNGTRDPEDDHEPNYIPTSALEPWSPTTAEWAVGMYARVTRDRPLNAWCVTGDTVQLVEPRRYSTDMFYVAQVDETGRIIPRDEHHYVPVNALEHWNPTPAHETPTPTPAGDVVPKADYDRLVEAVKADFLALSASLGREAESRGWCSEYEQVINRINGSLRTPNLGLGIGVFPERPEKEDFDFEVEAHISVEINDQTFTCSTYPVTVTGKGFTEEEAREEIDTDRVYDAVYDTLPSGCDTGLEILGYDFS